MPCELRSNGARALCAGTLAAVLAACATVPAGAPPGPERLSALEARVAAVPGDADARIELASAYRTAGRAADAAAAVRPVVDADPRNAAAIFQLALAEEAQGRWTEARTAYRRYLALGASPRLDRQARGRLVLLERRELQDAVRSALAQEEALRDRDPEPGTIGVFPFLVAAQNPQLRGLGVALAVMLSTDLAQTDRLRVLDRAQVQFLLDELALGQSDRVDPTTAARTGRILGAGRIVQGRVDGDPGVLRLQALTVPIATAALPTRPVEQAGAIATLFEMQKEMALALYEAMGVQLTAAERERVLMRPTQNVQALLAFGFGIEAADAGRFAEAQGHFEAALRLDPSFTLAQAERDRVRDLVEATDQSALALDRLAFLELGPGRPFDRTRDRFADIELIVPTPEKRDPVVEVIGVEGLDRRAIVEIIIRRPGGS
jgi:tetratricopeptide (TPR) repeat protein